MKNIGVIRKIDPLGRLTIPKEFRDLFDLCEGRNVEIIATEDGLLIRNPNIEVKIVKTETN